MNMKLFRRRLWPVLIMAAVPTWVAAQEEPALVRVDSVKTEPLEQTVPVIGRLVARQAGSIAARIGGPVERVLVLVGERVEKDQVVAELETGVLSVRRDLAGARLGEARALLATREAEYQLARQEVNRLERVKNSAVTTRAALDDAQQQAVIAKAKIAEARAAVDSAQANQRLAEIDLLHTWVRAPYAGVIVRLVTESGAYLRPGETVAEIVADQTLEAEADVPYDRLGGSIPGTVVRLVLDDGSEHEATVRAIIPQEDDLTRTRAVRFVPRFGPLSSPLAVDQSVTLYIPVGAPRMVLSVHKDGIIKRQGRDLVYVVDEDTANIKPVTLGQAVGSRFEVLNGLSEGDRVVVRGNERLQPGARVIVGGDPS